MEPDMMELDKLEPVKPNRNISRKTSNKEQGARGKEQKTRNKEKNGR
jgi:hypothetical protein